MDTDRLLFLLMGVCIGFALIIVIFFGFGIFDDYKRGQIDAITGNIKYELITKSDSTRIWEEKVK